MILKCRYEHHDLTEKYKNIPSKEEFINYLCKLSKDDPDSNIAKLFNRWYREYVDFYILEANEIDD